MEAFGLNVVKINGNDFDELEKAFDEFHKNMGSGKPFGIIMKTVKGLGVSYMEIKLVGTVKLLMMKNMKLQ